MTPEVIALELRHRCPGSGVPPAERQAAATSGILLGLVAALSWAGYSVASRAGLNQGLDAWDLTAARFTVAGMLMLPILLRAGLSTLGGVGWSRGAILAFCAGPVFSLLFSEGLSMTPFAHGPVIAPSVITLGSLSLGAAFLGERASAMRLLGVAGVVLGVVLVAGGGSMSAPQLASGSHWLGDLMFVGAGMLWALFTLELRRWAVSPALATAVVAVLSMAVVVPAYLATAGVGKLLALPMAFAWQGLMQGVLAAVVAVFAFSGAVARLGASKAGVFPSLVPALAVLLGIPVLGELPSWQQVAGLVCVSAGLVLAIGLLDEPGRDA